jgi:DNA repair protein RecO (recombination protein O)
MEHTAIILRTDPFRESDRIVTLFSSETGLLKLIAKGSQKITSKNASSLEPGLLIVVGIANGKELEYITSVQTIESFVAIRNDLRKSAAVLYVSHFLARTLKERDAHPELFAMYMQWLVYLNTHEYQMRLVDSFIFRVMAALGFKPVLNASAVSAVTEGLVAFGIVAGGVLTREEAREYINKGTEVIAIDDATKCAIVHCLQSTWPELASVQFSRPIAVSVHRIIFAYTRYYLERDIADWERVIHSFDTV